METDRTEQVHKMYVIQNRDKIARKEDYAHLAHNELIVHGVFPTLQGEGPFVGTPCVFLRLAGCNFGDKDGFCQWCDTDFKLESGKKMNYEEILLSITDAWMKAVSGSTERLLVITGGEPGLQPALPEFIRWLTRSRGWIVQVETNGTQHKFAREVKGIDNLTLVISPKAGVHGYGGFNMDAWAWGKNCLKFVVDSNPDAPHHEIPEFAKKWKGLGLDVYLSPMAVYLKEYKGEISSAWEDGLINKERTRQNYGFAASMALKKGYKLSIQQHLFAEIA